MSEQSAVWVFAEVEDGRVAEVSLELVTKAGELAARLKGGVAAVLLGDGVEPLADELFAHGCDEVYLAEDRSLRHYRTLPYAEVLVRLISAHRPEVVLFGATTTGRDLAPRVASELQVGLTADCTDLRIGPHQDIVNRKTYEKVLYQIRPAFGGNIIATIVSPERRPQMATVRPGVMHKAQAQPGRRGRLVRVPVQTSPEALVTDVLERVPGEKKVDLAAARIIVAGGAGVGSRENFRLIRELAEVLGAAVGASRAAVDAGFIDKAHQVGQTGTTVRPKLYIACGISGAVQHRVGMQNSGKIVAINTDPEAPIMQFAHYAIQGDLNEVIPRLIEAYRENTK